MGVAGSRQNVVKPTPTYSIGMGKKLDHDKRLMKML